MEVCLNKKMLEYSVRKVSISTANAAQLGQQYSISMQMEDCNDTMNFVRNLAKDIVKAVKADLHKAMTSIEKLSTLTAGDESCLDKRFHQECASHFGDLDKWAS